MLLGAAKMLSEKRDFEGAVHFIFQPAEEGGGGAQGDDRRRPVREIPLRCRVRHPQQAGHPARPHRHQGRARCWPPPTAGTSASPARAAMPRIPHLTIDPMVAGANIVMALQTIVSRNIDPHRRHGRHRRLLQGGLGLQRDPGRRAYRRHDPHHDAGEPRAGEAPHRGDLRRRRADARRQDRGRAPAGLSADGQQCRARAFALDVAAGVCGEHAVKDNVTPEHGRGGLLLHAGEGAGRHGDGWAMAAAPRPSACTTRAMTSTTWRSRSASASSCAPSSASSANSRHEHGCHPERSEGPFLGPKGPSLRSG